MRAPQFTLLLAGTLLANPAPGAAQATITAPQEPAAIAALARIEATHEAGLRPDRTLEALIERIDAAEARGDFETALSDAALAILLGAKLTARFEDLLRAGAGSAFVQNIERAWRTVHPSDVTPPTPSANTTMTIEPLVEALDAAKGVDQPTMPELSFELARADERNLVTTTRTALLSAPRFSGAPITTLAPGTPVERLQRFGVWSQVAVADGRVGFVPTRSLAAIKPPSPPATEPATPEPTIAVTLEPPSPANPETARPGPPALKPSDARDVQEIAAEDHVLTVAEPPIPIERLEAEDIPVAAGPPAPALNDQVRMSPIRPIWLRQGPGTESEPVGTVVPGEVLLIGESDGAWVRVTTEEGIAGYVGARWLEAL